MKVNFKYSIMAFAALTLGLTSCSNDDEVVGGGDAPQGERTAMQFVIRAPKAPATYATPPADGSATQKEIDLHTVDVLIYEKRGTDFILEAIESRGTGDFTASTTADEYELNSGKEIPTTTGEKRIFVAMNVPAGSVTYPVKGTPMSAVDLLKVSLATAGDLSSDTDGFAMFSTKEIGAGLVAVPTGGPFPASNRITATVKRLVAKVSVEEDAGLSTAGIIPSQGGWLKNLQFALGNINKTSYLLQNVKNDVVKDFNWGVFTSGDFFPISSYALASPDYKKVDDAGSTIASGIHPVYCPENTAQSYDLNGDNLTYVSVRAQYVPKFFCQADGTPDPDNTSSTPAVSFWTVLTPTGLFYFKNEPDAVQFTLANPGSQKSAEYVNGLCYFRGYLNKDGAADATIANSRAAKYDVLRNVYYKSVIKSINAPGTPTDTGGPKEATTLTMEVKVMPWETHTDIFDL